ncbi:MAG: choice-of-anchor J domain-containing protein, partial [FCB group bacterium]|nr:choice-of-anchor J domain-containing protein [FCB group bacterium]
MWRKLLLTGLVLTFTFSLGFASDAMHLTPMEKALNKYDSGQTLTVAEKTLISSELAIREAAIQMRLQEEGRLNHYSTNNLRSALSEGFEGAFPPAGWTVINADDDANTFNETFTYITAPEGTQGAQAMKCYDDWLITPKLSPTTGDASFSYQEGLESSSYPYTYQLLVSTTDADTASFTSIGSYDGNTTGWITRSIDLSAYVDMNIHIAWHMTSGPSTSWDFGFDDVSGPEIYVAPEPPLASTSPMPADSATGVALNQVVSWGASLGATGYDLSFGTDNPPTDVLDAADQGDVLTYTPTLAYATTYYWEVTPYNAYGDASGTVIWSFTTEDDPTLVPPFTETFETFETSYPYAPPMNWTKLAGLMDEDIELADPSYPDKWRGEAFANDSENPVSARMNVYYNNRMDWLISPPVDLGDGTVSYQAEFDIVAQEYNSTTVDAVWDDDDRFDFIISTDGGATWDQTNILLSHNSTTGLGATPVHEIIDLSAYTGVVKFAFYGETQVSNGDWELFVKDFTVQEPPTVPILALSDSEFDFGSAPVGGSVVETLTITNNGGADLNISSILPSDYPPFAIGSYSSPVAAGASMDVSITYEPTTAGDHAGTVTITSDDDLSPHIITVSGRAYPADYVLEGFEGDFPPFGWSNTAVVETYIWEQSSTYAYNGMYSARFKNSSYNTRTAELKTPKLDLTTSEASELSFYLRNVAWGSDQDELWVDISTDGGATWTNLAYYGTSVTDFELQTIDLETDVVQNDQAMIKFIGTTHYGYGVYIDDILMPPLAPNTNTPFFSEYMEGSSNNKGIEIYNLTGSTINLDEYQIAQSTNGGGWAYYHVFPEGATLDHEDLWLIANDGVFPEVIALADEVLPYPSVVHHNGDDARALVKIVGTDTTFLDIIGIPTEDPGAAWDVAGVTEGTKDHNLVRKPDVVTGNTDWALSAGTNADDSEWIVYDMNFWYGMGYHNEDYLVPGDACDLPLVYGDVNDPAMVGSIESYGATWYTFYNDGSYDNVFASLCGSTFDTKIEVWAGCDSATYIAYNDDACGTQSEVDLGELPAGDYWVKVFGYGSGSGEYTLNVTGTNGVPDFVVSSMEYYGQDTLDVVVTNIGDGDSPGYFGTDYHGLYIDGDYLGYVAELDIALLAGESYTYSLTGINFDNFGPGMHQVVFEADTDDDVLEIDETNNNDTLTIDIGYPPLAPRHVMAMAGEGEVFLSWETAVIPPPMPGSLARVMSGIHETKTKAAATFDPEVLAKRDAAGGSAFRDAGDTCAEAVELTVADGSVVTAPYQPYWYSFTAVADGYLTATSDGTSEDTYVRIFDDCEGVQIAYNDDIGFPNYASLVSFPIVNGTTYYIQWDDVYSVATFDWTLTYMADLPMADLDVTEMYIEGDAVMAVITNIGDIDAAGVSCHWWVNGVDVAYEYTDLLAPTEADTLGLYGFSWANLGPGTFNVMIDVDFWGSVDELSEENNTDSITVILEDPDYMPTYNVYRDDALLAGGVEAVNRDFDGEFLDDTVTPDVLYTYYITQIMEDLSESLASESVSATPFAPVFYPFPFTEDFEAVMDNMLPLGYIVEEIGEPDGSQWEVGDSAYFEGNLYNYWNVPGGTQFAGIDDDGWGSGVNGNEILWTPWVDFASAVNPQILFNYTVQGGLGGEFLVFDGDDVMVYPLADSPNDWTGVLFNLGDYVGDVVRFGFHYNDNGGWAYGMGVDNITVDEAPPPGVITGTITDTDGNALGFADVHAMGLFADEGTMADAAGAYSITVPAGDYTVEVMRVNYHPAMEMAVVTEGGTTTLDFVLDMYLPAPENLMAYPSMVDTTIGLMWAPPVPMGQVAYDDGSFEGFVAPVIPSTEHNYFASHFKAAITPGYAINEISILTTALDTESALESVSVVGSDEMGGPDLSNVLWTTGGVNAALYPDAAWDFYPVGVAPATADFWVVMKWPVGNEAGPYVGHDDDTFIGNSIWANAADSLGVPLWIMDPGTFAVRAYLAEPSTGRSMVLHGSETVNIEKLGAPIELSVKQDVVSTVSVEAPNVTTVGRELLNYNVYRSLDPMVFGDVYANVAGEMFNDDDFDFDTPYF